MSGYSRQQHGCPTIRSGRARPLKLPDSPRRTMAGWRRTRANSLAGTSSVVAGEGVMDQTGIEPVIASDYSPKVAQCRGGSLAARKTRVSLRLVVGLVNL